MKHPLPLEYNTCYHIYNRGINGEDLFREPPNYEHFIRLYSEYIDPVCETYAWVLMKNHFHFLVRIFAPDEIDFMKPKEEKKNNVYPIKKKYNPTQQFGNLCNAYAKAFNNRYDRTGSLFESSFRRIPVHDEGYFKQFIYYIHNNPVHHGFCESMVEYPWSSYLNIISDEPTILHCDKIVAWFNSTSELIEFHQQNHGNRGIESFIIE
jgi:putative transposase